MAGFLAYILPVDQGAHPEHPIAPGGQPPGIWNPVFPSPPIANVPGAPGYDPGKPPGIWIPVFPSPPIANVPGAPGYRPGGDHIWGGGNVPMPTPPINLPPGTPPGFWGPNDPRPQPPIVIPPELPPELPPPSGGGDKPPPADGGWGYVSQPGFGWGYFPAGGGDKPNPPGVTDPAPTPTAGRR